MTEVICSNIIIGDGFCKECKHSKPHDPDTSCDVDCPYEFAVERECIPVPNDPRICDHSYKCWDVCCYHMNVHEFAVERECLDVCPSYKNAKCINPLEY